MNAPRILVAILMLAIGVGAARDLSRLGAAAPWHTMYDFPDFYCAGWSIDRHASPYTYEPLHACEHAVNIGSSFRGEFFRANPTIAVPAPLPAYDFVPYMVLARMPTSGAARIAAAAILASVALAAIALAALGLPLDLVAASLILSTAYMELNTGQIVPFALLALVLGGLALARGNDRAAGVFAVLAAIEPSVGLPVVLATLLFVPRARWSLAVTAALLGILSVVLVGSHALVQYATAVLPAQAAAEVHFPFQYSLTYAIAKLGLSPSFASIAGVASYFILLAAGLVLAPRVSARLQRRELIVFIPALCAIIGGTYVHPEELCFALPALLVFSLYGDPGARKLCAVALCALAVPWILVWGEKQLFLASIFACAVILLRLRVGARVTIATLCALAALIYLFELHPPRLPTPTARPRIYVSDELVQTAWRDYAEQRRSADPLWFAIKLPGWLALLAGFSVAVGYGATRYSVSTG